VAGPPILLQKLHDKEVLEHLRSAPQIHAAGNHAAPGLRGDNYSRINTPEIFTVLMKTMDRQTIIMQRVHHVLIVAFHFLM